MPFESEMFVHACGAFAEAVADAVCAVEADRSGDFDGDEVVALIGFLAGRFRLRDCAPATEAALRRLIERSEF